MPSQETGGGRVQPRVRGGIPWLEILYIRVAVGSRLLLLCERWAGGWRDPFEGSLGGERNAARHTVQPHVGGELLSS